MRYYMIAGERSGDLHGGNLAKALKTYDPSLEMRGFGGEYMTESGVDVTVHYKNMALMGMVEILMNLKKISRYTKQCKDDILLFNPDVIILIDYGGFNLRIAKWAKRNNIKVFYYIPPKVWAWYQSRAWQLKKCVDKLFTILPFEKEFFKKFDWDVDYVGNPVLDAVKAHNVDATFLTRHRINSDASLIAVLPGSRKQELQQIIPTIAAIVTKNPSLQFVVAAVKNLNEVLYEPLSMLSNVKFVFEETYDLLTHAKAAIVTSGTATLETALFRVPQIVVYKTSYLTYQIVKRLIKVQFISLVNLIATKEVVKEMIQEIATPENISHELNMLLNNQSYRKEMLDGYDQIIKTLDTGSASENAAKLMVGYLKSS